MKGKVDFKSNYIFYVFMIVYLSYILLEFSFNGKLLSITSLIVVNGVFDFSDLEFMGKTLSSIGVAAFTFTVARGFIKGRSVKIAALLMSFILGITFFSYQESFLNNIISKTDSDFRRNAESSLVLKTGIANGVLDGKDYNIPDLNEKQRGFLLSSLGILNQGLSVSLDDFVNNKSEMYPAVFREEVSLNQDKLYKEYLKYKYFALDKWKDYERVLGDVGDKHKQVMGRVNYTKINSSLSIMHTRHRGYAKLFSEGKRSRGQVAGELAINYLDFASCSDYKCVTSGRGMRIFKTTFNKVLKGRSDLVGSYFKKCTFSNSDNPYGVVYIDGKKVSEKKSNIVGSRNSYVCNIDSFNLYSEYIKNYEGIAYDKYGLRSVAVYENLNDFANLDDIKKIIASDSEKYGLKVDFEDLSLINIDYTNEKTFSNSMFSIVRNVVEREFNESMVSKYGFEIPLNIRNVESFLLDKSVRAIVLNESNGLIDSGDWALDLDRDGFAKKSIELLPSVLSEQFYNKDLMNEYGEKVTKAVVLPPVFIALSLFFGVINFINFMFILFEKYIRVVSRTYMVSYRVLVYILVLIIPMFFSFGFDSGNIDETIIDEVYNSSLILYYVFRWVLGVYYLI